MAKQLGDVRQPLVVASDSEWPDLGTLRARQDLEAIYQRHGGPVYDLARVLCGPARAPAVVTATFVSLWTMGPEDNSEGVTLRCALLRRCYLAAINTGNPDEALEVETPTSNADVGGSQTVTMDDRCSSENRLDSLLYRLTEPEQAALAVVHYGRCTCNEAAVVLGVEVEAVAAHLRSGLFRLHTLMNR